MNKSMQVGADLQTIQRTCLSLVGERGGLITSQSANGITASFTTRPSIVITLILFLFGFLPGLIYYWFAGRTYQLVVQYHEVDASVTQFSVTASGGRAKKVANSLIKSLSVGKIQINSPQAMAQPSQPLPSQPAAAPLAPPLPQSFATTAPTGTRFCISCGKPLSDGVRFCTACGAPAQSAAPAQSPQAVPGVNVVAAPTYQPAVAVAAVAAQPPRIEEPSDNDGLTIAAEDELLPPQSAVGDSAASLDADATVIDEPEPEPEPLPLLDAELISELHEPIALTLFTEEQRVTVGRDSTQADFAVADPRASRVHFTISTRDGAGVVTDMGSSNGTYVNGVRIEMPHFLNDGDRVALGRTELTYRTRVAT